MPARAGASGLLVEPILLDLEAQPVILAVDRCAGRAPKWRKLGVKGVEGGGIATPQGLVHLPVRILEEGHPSPRHDNLESASVPVDDHAQGSGEPLVENAPKRKPLAKLPETKLTRHALTLTGGERQESDRRAESSPRRPQAPRSSDPGRG